jgi:hypothetical protein
MPDGTLEAKVTAKVGPVSARFSGKVQLLDIVAPESYRLVFTGQGGAAGFARGEASVRLRQEAPNVTELQYTTEATVGGKLAQIGSRLIEASARKLADDFFGRFGQALRETAQPDGMTATAEAAPAPAPDTTRAAPTALAVVADTPAPKSASLMPMWAIATAGLVLGVGAYLLFV